MSKKHIPGTAPSTVLFKCDARCPHHTRGIANCVVGSLVAFDGSTIPEPVPQMVLGNCLRNGSERVYWIQTE